MCAGRDQPVIRKALVELDGPVYGAPALGHRCIQVIRMLMAKSCYGKSEADGQDFKQGSLPMACDVVHR